VANRESRRAPHPGRITAAGPGRTASARCRAARRLGIGLATAPAVFAGAAVLAQARYVTGPPPAHTGGFGEPTCYACHYDVEPNSGPGSLVLRGLEAGYEPGVTRRITVELASPGMRRGGFELAARFATGAAAGQQAGTLRALDERAAVTDSAGVQYAHHLEAGIDLAAPDTARWVLEWTAPEEGGGTVIFHIAANAANDDASPFGDLIFTDSVRVPAAAAKGREAGPRP
jgi:hypothetical protein